MMYKYCLYCALIIGLHFGSIRNASMKNCQEQTAPLSRRDQRNADIRNEYFHLFRSEGKRNEVILTQLAKKWYMAEDTIERIVFQRGHYKPQSVAASSARNRV